MCFQHPVSLCRYWLWNAKPWLSSILNVKQSEAITVLSFTVLLPLLLSIPLISIGIFFYSAISDFLSKENQ
jgi:hypothetical protein